MTRLHNLGWRHRIALGEGIESTYQWFLTAAQGARCRCCNRCRRVKFDLDGTVADMYSALRRRRDQAVRRRGAAQRPAASAPQDAAQEQAPQPKADEDQAATLAIQELHLTARQQDQLWDHVKQIENFWATLPSSSRASSHASPGRLENGAGK